MENFKDFISSVTKVEWALATVFVVAVGVTSWGFAVMLTGALQ